MDQFCLLYSDNWVRHDVLGTVQLQIYPVIVQYIMQNYLMVFDDNQEIILLISS